ncbi:MAG TPA: Holliday junction resolvase RuvX [Bryobacteraceae bacterium]|nr:Holliday junction resolvase RuvX [Bryobacteraceae bacterium]
MTDAPAFRRGRVLALDVGRRRIGLAISDETRTAVRGLPTLERTKSRQDVARIAAIASEYDAGLLLIGLPVDLNGADTEMTEHARAFAAQLQRRTRLPVEFEDERLTSFEAEQRLGGSVAKRERRGGIVDQTAAVLLLEAYLRSNSAFSGIHSPEADA